MNELQKRNQTFWFLSSNESLGAIVMYSKISLSLPKIRHCGNGKTSRWSLETGHLYGVGVVVKNSCVQQVSSNRGCVSEMCTKINNTH